MSLKKSESADCFLDEVLVVRVFFSLLSIAKKATRMDEATLI